MGKSESSFLNCNQNNVNQNNFDEFFSAIQHGLAEKFEELVVSIDVNYIDTKGASPLLKAAQFGRVDFINRLIDLGADVKAAISPANFTPLHFAAMHGRTKVIETLIQRGADINAKDYRDYSPLHHAVINKHNEAIQTLIELGADINAKAEEDYTALHIASQMEDIVTVTKLLERGASISQAQDKSTAYSRAGNNDIKYMLIHVQLIDNMTSKNTVEMFKRVIENIPELWKRTIEDGLDDRTEELLKKRIINKIFCTYDINVQGIQRKIVDNIKNFNLNELDKKISLIQEKYKSDLSFLKEVVHDTVRSDDDSTGFVHPNGMGTLFSLALAKLVQSNTKEFTKLNGNILDKALCLLETSGFSRLFNLPDNIADTIKAVILKHNQAQYFENIEDANSSIQTSLTIGQIEYQSLSGNSIDQSETNQLD